MLKLTDWRKYFLLRFALFLAAGFFVVSLGGVVEALSFSAASEFDGQTTAETGFIHRDDGNQQNHTHDEGHCLSANCYSIYVSVGQIVPDLRNADINQGTDFFDLLGIIVSPPIGPPRIS